MTVNHDVAGSSPACGVRLAGRVVRAGRRSTIGNRVDGSNCLKGSNPLLSVKYMQYHLLTRPVGQAVKTPPFHGGNTGSNPVRVIKTKYSWRISSAGRASALQAECRRFDPVILHLPNKLVRWCRG